MSGANYVRPETTIDQIEVLDLLCQDSTVKLILDILSSNVYTKGGRINKSAFGKKFRSNMKETDEWLEYVRQLTMFYSGTGPKPARPLHPPRCKKYRNQGNR